MQRNRISVLTILVIMCNLTACNATPIEVKTLSPDTTSAQVASHDAALASGDIMRNAQPLSIRLPSGVIPLRLATDDKYIYWINIHDPFSIDRISIDKPDKVERVATSNPVSRTVGTGFSGLQISKDGLWMSYYEYTQYDSLSIHVVLRIVNIETGRTQILFERIFDMRSLDRPFEVFVPMNSIDNNTAILNYTTPPDVRKCVYSVVDIYKLDADTQHELIRGACNSQLEWRQPFLYKNRLVVSQLDWVAKPARADAYLFDLMTGVSQTLSIDGKESEPLVLDKIVAWRNAYALDFTREVGIHNLDRNVTRYVTLQQEFAHLDGAGDFLVAITPSRVDLIDTHDFDNIQVITIAAVDPDKLPPFGERTITRKYFAYVEYVSKKADEAQSLVWIYRLKQ